ncbi:MAG: hypothetical protein OEU46_05470 [Alphaproteobacteria bacterium]|nr:hypothetical protein [Alphaproteobacteria bacterium]
MKRITSIFPLLALFVTILIGSVTVGATIQDSQPSESPRGMRRMLQTLDAPNVVKMEVTSAARQILNTRFQ